MFDIDMLNANMVKVQNALLGVDETVKDVIVVGPKGSYSFKTRNKDTRQDLVDVVFNSRKDLGINLNVLNDVIVEKIDTALYQVEIKEKTNEEDLKTMKVKEINLEEALELAKKEESIKVKVAEEKTNKEEGKKNTMIKTTGFNNTIAGLNRKMAVENTKENFMNRMGKEYGESIAKDENLGVGQITIASNVYSSIALLDDEQFKPLAFRALESVLGDMEGFNTGAGEYHGLLVDEIRADNINMDLVTVSSEQEEMIIQEMLTCDLNDINNLRKIFADINDLFRMYQELTIDAAKKLYVIVATFYNEVMKANSTVKLDHNFNSFKDFTSFEIKRTSEYVAPKETALGEPVEFVDNEGKLKKIAFKDKTSEVQDVISDQFVSLISNDVLAKYKEVKVSDKVKALFGLGSQFNAFADDMYYAIRAPYSKATTWKAQEIAKAHELQHAKKYTAYQCSQRIDEVNAMYDKMIEELSNLARFYTKDMDMALAGRLMFMIANIKREGNMWLIDEESTNQVFLAVAPELFTAYIVAEHAELKVCGYKVLGDTKDLVEGQVLTFVNGNAQEVENVYVDSDFTGELTVQMVNDVLSVVKPIEIPRIEATTPESITISLMESTVIDAAKFARTREYTKTSTFKTLSSQNVFEKATKIQLVPLYTYIDSKGKTNHVMNAVVVTVPNINDPSVTYEIPVCRYSCQSAAFESIIAGLTADKVLKTRIDGRTMRMSLEYGTFEKVDLFHSKVKSDEVIEINNDIFAPSVQFSNKTFEENFVNPFTQTEAPAPATYYRSGGKAFGDASSTNNVFDELDGLFADTFGSDYSSSIDMDEELNRA